MLSRRPAAPDAVSRYGFTRAEWLAMTYEEVTELLPDHANDEMSDTVTLDEFAAMSPEEAFKLPDMAYARLNRRLDEQFQEEYRPDV